MPGLDQGGIALPLGGEVRPGGLPRLGIVESLPRRERDGGPDDVVGQRVRGGAQVRLHQPGPAQRGLEELGPGQHVRPEQRPADQRRRPRVPEHRGPPAEQQCLDVAPPVPPGCRRFGEGDLAEDLVQSQVEYVVLVGDVPVERGGAGAEPLGQPAHGEPADALSVEQFDRRTDDPVPVQRRPAAARGTRRSQPHSCHDRSLVRRSGSRTLF
ncbi:hypothetical protein GCM10027615_08810 [Plantactinospora veratri]